KGVNLECDSDWIQDLCRLGQVCCIVLIYMPVQILSHLSFRIRLTSSPGTRDTLFIYLHTCISPVIYQWFSLQDSYIYLTPTSYTLFPPLVPGCSSPQQTVRHG